MPLHQGKGSAPEGAPVDPAELSRLSLNPFYGEADPVSQMTSAPPTHRLPDGPIPPCHRLSAGP